MTAVRKHLTQSIIWRGFYFITLLLVNIVLSRVLKAEGAGIVFYLTNLFAFGVLVFSANLDGGFTFYASSKTIAHEKLASLAILWTLIMGLLAYLLIPIYFKHFDSDILYKQLNKSYLGIYYLVGVLFINFFTALFYSNNNYFVPNVILGLSNLMFIGLVYFGVVTNASNSDIIQDYFQFITFQGSLLLIAYFTVYKVIPKIELPNSRDLKALFHYSSISLLGNFLFFFVYRLDYWFVKDWCKQTGDLGNYIQASKLAQMLLVLPQILASSIFPQLASGNNTKDIIESITKLCRLFIVVFAIIFLIIFCFGKTLFPFVFGVSFSSMYWPMLILLPGILCLCCSTLLSAYFSGKKQNQINLYAAAIALTIMLVSTFLFKSYYTIIIAAGISSIAYFIEAFYCFIQFSKHEKISWKQFFKFCKQDWMWIKNLFAR
ncbi:MAG: hypothetical protein KGZ59_03480 [Chitinophagaceae bacterium]|nr:hypothetical protein [Chitinophagaceae bacterium]